MPLSGLQIHADKQVERPRLRACCTTTISTNVHGISSICASLCNVKLPEQQNNMTPFSISNQQAGIWYQWLLGKFVCVALGKNKLVHVIVLVMRPLVEPPYRRGGAAAPAISRRASVTPSSSTFCRRCKLADRMCRRNVLLLVKIGGQKWPRDVGLTDWTQYNSFKYSTTALQSPTRPRMQMGLVVVELLYSSSRLTISLS
jgi:hypothetical protein